MAFNSNDSMNEKIINKRDSLKQSITAKYSAMLEKVTTYNQDNDFSAEGIKIGLSSSSLNMTAIKNYARNNYYKSQPSSGGSGVPYYDFSEISGNWDCTNFVSHALLSGGASVYDTGNPSTGWYYNNLNDRSYSWSSVSHLYSFLTSNTSQGPGGSSTTYGYSYTTNRDGQIIQHHNGSIWRHSTIVTGYYHYAYGLFGSYVTGRASDHSYNNNAKAESIYPGYSKRIIKPVNY